MKHADPTAVIKNRQMKTLRKATLSTRAGTVAGVLWMLSALSPAAFVSLPSGTPEISGVLMELNTPGALSGTVLAVLDSDFVFSSGSFASGTLRSFVIDRDPTSSIALDFVYQLVNTTFPPPPDSDFFRLRTIGGFDAPFSLAISVANTNAFAGLIAGPGSGFVAGSYTQSGSLKPAFSADRDVGTPGSIGFDFGPSHFLGDPTNVGPGNTSSFLVVSTGEITTFGIVDVAISGFGTSFPFPTALAPIGAPVTPVPELGPGLIGFGLVMLGMCFLKGRVSAPQNR